MPEIIKLFFKYFPFIAISVNILNLAIARRKFARPELLFFFLAFNSVFLVMGVLQLLGGYETFFYIFLSPLSSPLVLIFWIYYFAFLGLDILWVLFGNGAAILADSGLVRGLGMGRPLNIKIFSVAFAIVFIVFFFIGYQFGFFEEMVNGIGAILDLETTP